MTERAPLPGDVVPDDLDQPFWDACRAHTLLLHRCRQCDRHYWPASCCIEHGSASMEWVPSRGFGTVETYSVFHHVYARTFLDVPYNVAVIRLEEGPLFHSRIIGDEPLSVGLEVEVTFEDGAEGLALPLFRPRGVS